VVAAYKWSGTGDKEVESFGVVSVPHPASSFQQQEQENHKNHRNQNIALLLAFEGGRSLHVAQWLQTVRKEQGTVANFIRYSSVEGFRYETKHVCPFFGM
jgi:hypothetical protein